MSGFPAGLLLAWAITLAETTAAVLLILGRWVRPATLVFGGVLTAGILLVHGREGWFVVGGGRNGVEYSVTLLVGLAALWIAHGRPQAPQAA